MKFGILQFRYFTEGEYVRTPDGVGIVVEDEKEINSERDLFDSDVIVQHKYGCSSNASNQPLKMSRDIIFRIDQDEYNAEKKW